jgi:hypothetical protein
MLLGSPEEQAEREEGYLFPTTSSSSMKPHHRAGGPRARSGSEFRSTVLRSTIQRLYNARSKKGLFTVTRDAAGVKRWRRR